MLLKDTFIAWNDRDSFGNSTILAFYMIFSLPGLLVIIITIAGYFFGEKEVTEEVTTQVQKSIGGNTAKQIESIVNQASQTESSIWGTILGIATLLFGATGVFYQLQKILNRVWGVKPNPRQKILKFIRDRLFSFGLILVVGFLLLVSLLLSTAISAASNWFSDQLDDYLIVIFKVLDIVVSIAIITLLFAAIYKFLPDVKIEWSDVWIGAFLTAVLFVIGKFLLGLYFGYSNPASVYGAAGSIILIMLWLSYAGLIILFGAEFTRVYANRYGRKILPSEVAEPLDPPCPDPEDKKKQAGR